MIVVSDTSPVANLLQIQQLWILGEVFKEVIIPPAVDAEIQKLTDFSIPIESYLDAPWILRQKPQNAKQVEELQTFVDLGESEAIALSLELGANYLLIDERIGTRIAREKGLETIGPLGVLVKAKQSDIVGEVKPLSYQLIEIAGFGISDKLVERILAEVNEL